MGTAVESACASGGPSEMAGLAERINAEHRAAERAAKSAIDHALRAGELLIEAKSAVGHGDWLPWLAENFEGSERTAQTYMRVARRWPQLEGKAQRVPDLGVREAVRLLSEPKPRIPSYRERFDVEWENLRVRRSIGGIFAWASKRGIPDAHRLQWMLPSKGYITSTELASMWCGLPDWAQERLTRLACQYAGAEPEDYELSIYDLACGIADYAGGGKRKEGEKAPKLSPKAKRFLKSKRPTAEQVELFRRHFPDVADEDLADEIRDHVYIMEHAEDDFGFQGDFEDYARHLASAFDSPVEYVRVLQGIVRQRELVA